MDVESCEDANAGGELAESGLTGPARVFLRVFAESGNVTLASRAAGQRPSAHYMRLERDPVYDELFEEAREAAFGALMTEARRRAVDGWDEPVFQRGQQCGIVHKYSDPLLITLLKAGHLAEFTPRPARLTQIVDARGSSGPISIEAADIGRIEVSPSRQADYDAFLELLHRAAERRGGDKRVANEIIDQERHASADAHADASADELASPQPQPLPPTDRPTNVPTEPPNDPPCDQDQPL